MSKLTRSEAREEAFRVIFSLEFQNNSEDSGLSSASFMKNVLEKTIENFSSENDKKVTASFMKDILNKTVENFQEIDEHIKKNLNKWKFERINKVDLALLRVAICEIIFLETPKPVAIAESLKLASEYNGSETFINGVLANL
ncbi:MAG: transcription antitermination factor NusB [Defluviitaleaceae bacterium]|nr:transcription antitermination factor NusB [Defluviitaleaceae bacterium]